MSNEFLSIPHAILKNTLRFLDKYSELPIYDINPFS
jgi:hypothetical protein